MEEICRPCSREDLEEILEEIWTTLELKNEIPASGARIPTAAAGDKRQASSAPAVASYAIIRLMRRFQFTHHLPPQNRYWRLHWRIIVV